MQNNTEKVYLHPMSGRIPVRDIVCIDAKQQIWKGKIADFPDNETPDSAIVFFSRKYDEKNDLDRCLCEVEMPDSIIGVTFWLIPKEKMLCNVMPRMTDGGIMIPVPQGMKKRFGRQ